MENRNTALIQTLNECASVCNYCASACLGEPNVANLTRCISTDLDCADICAFTARLLARGSRHAEHLLAECAEICNICAGECEKHAGHHDHCRACAEMCRKCAAACA